MSGKALAESRGLDLLASPYWVISLGSGRLGVKCEDVGVEGEFGGWDGGKKIATILSYHRLS